MKRYDADDTGEMHEAPEGEFVRHEDLPKGEYPTTCRMRVKPETVEKVMEQFRAFLTQKIKEKSDVAWASSHETLGMVTEEYIELQLAVKDNDHAGVTNELFDIMTCAFWGIASRWQGAWTW